MIYPVGHSDKCCNYLFEITADTTYWVFECQLSDDSLLLSFRNQKFLISYSFKELENLKYDWSNQILELYKQRPSPTEINTNTYFKAICKRKIRFI